MNDDAAKRPTPQALLVQVLLWSIYFVHSEVQLRFQVVDDLEVVVEVVVEVVIEVVVAVVGHCYYGGMLDAAITENGVCGNEPDVNRRAISHSNGVRNGVGSEAGWHA